MIPKSNFFFLQITVKARGIELVEFNILYLLCQALKLNNEESISTMCLCMKPLPTENFNVKNISKKAFLSDKKLFVKYT